MKCVFGGVCEPLNVSFRYGLHSKIDPQMLILGTTLFFFRWFVSDCVHITYVQPLKSPNATKPCKHILLNSAVDSCLSCPCVEFEHLKQPFYLCKTNIGTINKIIYVVHTIFLLVMHFMTAYASFLCYFVCFYRSIFIL